MVLFSTITIKVEIRLKTCDACFREVSELLGNRKLTVGVTVVIRAVWFLAVRAMLTLLYLEEVWVVLLLLPAMWVEALVLIGTPLWIRADEIVHLPVWTHFTWVEEHRRTAPEILPIMSIYAYLTIVVIFAIGAPNSLEMKHVEVHVDIILFDHFYG